MSNYNTSKSVTDQSVNTIDQTGTNAELLTNVRGTKNRIETTDLSDNSGVVFSDVRRVGDVNMTDHGAVNASLDFAREFGSEALAFGGDALKATSESSAAALTKTGEAISRVGELAESFKNGGSSKTMLWVSVGFGVVAVVTVIAVTQGGKK